MTMAPALLANTKLDILCIGTPNIIGDSIGPLIGSILSCHKFESDVQIVGTIDEPVMQSTYQSMLERLRDDATVLVIDAAVGKAVGTYEWFKGVGLVPGAAMYLDNPIIGDMAIKCYTAASLRDIITCSVEMVSDMAGQVTTELLDLLGITNKKVYIEINLSYSKKAFN